MQWNRGKVHLISIHLYVICISMKCELMLHVSHEILIDAICIYVKSESMLYVYMLYCSKSTGVSVLTTRAGRLKDLSRFITYFGDEEFPKEVRRPVWCCFRVIYETCSCDVRSPIEGR